MIENKMTTEDEIQREFADSVELTKLHRFMIQEDGMTHFGLLEKNGKNNYFKVCPEVLGQIALEIINLATASQRVKAGNPEKSISLPFNTTGVLTVIPQGEGANGAIEFQFLTDNNTMLSTFIGPQLAAEMASSLLHVLSTMPSPPRIYDMPNLHSKLKGKDHSGQNTEIFFGQSYDVKTLKILGILVIRANLLEGAMAQLLACLLDISSSRAEAIFYSTQNMKARIDMLKAATASSDLNEKLQTGVSKHIDKIEKISRRRNQLIHGEWSFFKEKFSVRERKPLAPTKLQTVIESYKSIEEICSGFHHATVFINVLCDQIKDYRTPKV